MPTIAAPTPPAPSARKPTAARRLARRARQLAWATALGTALLASYGPSQARRLAPARRPASGAKTPAAPSPKPSGTRTGAPATAQPTAQASPAAAQTTGSSAALPVGAAGSSALLSAAPTTSSSAAPPVGAAGSSAAPSAAPSGAVRPAGSAVFFAVEGNPERGPLTLIPLSCYDAGKKARAVGEACLPLLPAGAMVQTAGGPLQLGAAATPQCPRQPLMGGRRLVGKVKAAPFLYGAWPSLAAVRYAEVPERSLHGTMAPIEKLVRKAITAATSLLVADLAIYQIIALSLRSDHTLQKLYSVVVPDRRGHTKWSGLLIGDVQGKQAAVAGADELPGIKQHSMQVVGHLDIDHDGKLELVVNSGGENLDRYSVREYDGTMLNVVSYWHSCGD